MYKYLSLIFLVVYTLFTTISYPKERPQPKVYSDDMCETVYQDSKLTIKVYRDLVGKLPEGFLDSFINDSENSDPEEIIIWDYHNVEEELRQ